MGLSSTVPAVHQIGDARGCLTACRYDGELPLPATVQSQSEQVIAETFTWDALNNLTAAIVHYAQPTRSGCCPAEQTVRYEYDNPDHLTRRTHIQYGGADARRLELVYDSAGRLIFDGHRLQ
ncbi:hypothetical protein SGGMMB4_01813 [Sodalis glossinidius str. 'morsitans']|uniref:Uncharacterized protein n=1 Tax=Sodalis glossinidius (strain morsitans) TaxID=343509 RepID=A0A193QHH2_SODGM|nr:hypothetical protein [Sodalis glossinidius]CRL44616.1 hypothetical protein SGGMMB4_01813 [Sodalis glossinidius str. 'morsitans']